MSSSVNSADTPASPSRDRRRRARAGRSSRPKATRARRFRCRSSIRRARRAKPAQRRLAEDSARSTPPRSWARPAIRAATTKRSSVCEPSSRVKKFCRAIIVPLVSQFAPPGHPATLGGKKSRWPICCSAGSADSSIAGKSERLVRSDDELDGTLDERAIGARAEEDVAAPRSCRRPA